MKKKLAIIGASYLQMPLVIKANELGIETHCFAWKDGAVCKDEANYYYPISIIEKDLILEECCKIKIDGICTIASDVAAPTVAYVAEQMGLVGNTYECSVQANNKYLMRNAFRAAKIPCPSYCMVKGLDELSTIDLAYPLIVKPSDRSGSLGVAKVTNQAELECAVQNAVSLSFRNEAIIEEYVEGREVSVEFISYRGIHYPLQITDKVTTGAPHFVELQHHQPSTLSKKQYKQLYDLTSMALNSLNITNGASHSEYKITDDGRVIIMEVGARMGGDFIGSDLVQLSTGYDFVKGVIDVALGTFERPSKIFNKCSGVYFLCKETEYIKPIIDNWQNNPSFVEGKITNQKVCSVTCSSERSGYVIYQSDDKIEI